MPPIPRAPHSTKGKTMREYRITVVTHDGDLRTFFSISASWYDAWEATVADFGISALRSILPVGELP